MDFQARKEGRLKKKKKKEKKKKKKQNGLVFGMMFETVFVIEYHSQWMRSSLVEEWTLSINLSLIVLIGDSSLFS